MEKRGYVYPIKGRIEKGLGGGWGESLKNLQKEK